METGIADLIQEDAENLDKMDAEISALLKKRQNGYLMDDEKISCALLLCRYHYHTFRLSACTGPDHLAAVV